MLSTCANFASQDKLFLGPPWISETGSDLKDLKSRVLYKIIAIEYIV